MADGHHSGSYQEASNQVVQSGYSFLKSSLQHKSELVVYEAARAIFNLSNAEPEDFGPALSILVFFLRSPKPAVRFAAIRTLKAFSHNHPPEVVEACNRIRLTY